MGGGRGKAKGEDGVEGILKSIHIARGVQTEKASALKHSYFFWGVMGD